MKTTITYICLSLFLLLCFNCSEDKIEITGKGGLSGKAVTVGNNEPLNNVKISTSPSSSIVFTDVNGNFSIPNINTGSYSVQAEKQGFLTIFEAVTIIEESNATVIFELDVETANNDAPNAPTLVSPANNTVDAEIAVTLTWSGSDPDNDTLTYGLKLLNDQNSDVLEFTDITEETYTVTGLQYGTKYFWQVSASDGINNATLSEIYNFETLDYPDNRIFFTRKVNGNNVIFSTDGIGNEFQLTSETSNSWRPRRASTIDKIAFLRSNGGETHIYTMDLDGSNVFQVTNTISVTGFNLEEIDFAWKSNDTQILYPNFDKLYQITTSGASLSEVHQTTNGNFISEVDWNENTSKIALKTNNNDGYNVEIYTINTSGVIQDTVLTGVLGAAGGLDFSFDGNTLLYTRDLSENENPQYRQLNTDMFIYNLTTTVNANISLNKPGGTNDLDARFSPNEAKVIFVNTSNDGISQKNVQVLEIDVIDTRETIIDDAKMPDWK